MKKYDIVLKETPLEDGLTKQDILDIYDKMNEPEVLFCEISGAFSIAIGMIALSVAEELDYTYDDDSELGHFISNILYDMRNESSNGEYNFEYDGTSYSVYLSRNL